MIIPSINAHPNAVTPKCSFSCCSWNHLPFMGLFFCFVFILGFVVVFEGLNYIMNFWCLDVCFFCVCGLMFIGVPPKKNRKKRSNSWIKKVITFNIMCCVLVLFTSGTWQTMRFAKPVAFWFYLHQENVHVVCRLLRSSFVHIRKTSMWFAKPVVFWFCLCWENVHVLCKACYVLVLFALGKCPCGLKSMLHSGFVHIRKTSLWFAKPVVFWFCSHQKNVHVVCKACCIVWLRSQQENVLWFAKTVVFRFVRIRKMTMQFAKPG